MFTHALGLFALLALPAIFALHWFRRRFEERRVAGLFLFPREALVADAGRTRTRLLRSWSLLLELLAALVLALLFSGLTCGARDGARHLVVVLDHSASMGASGVSATIADKARNAIRARLAALGSDSLATVIATGTHPEIVVGPRATQGEVEEFLKRFEPIQPGHDLSIALDLARDLSGNNDDRLLITDDPNVAPSGFDVEAVGEKLPNLAIVNARRLREDGQERLYLDVRAFSDVPLTSSFRITTLDGSELLTQPLEFAPDGSRSLALDLPEGTPAIDIRLGEDALAIDDRAILLPEPPGVVNVAVLVDPETRDALALERVLSSLDRVTRVSDPANAHWVIAQSPGELRAWQTELDIRSSPAGRNGDAISDWLGPFLLERRHPLLAGVALEGVVWSAPDGPLPGLPLVLAGDQPLLSEVVEGTAVRLHLALAPERSNLPNAPDWPILMANVATSARSRLPGVRDVNLTLGDPIDYRRAANEPLDAQIEVRDPQGDERPARGGMIATYLPIVCGMHTVLVDDNERAQVAVRFLDPSESDLRQRGMRSSVSGESVTNELEGEGTGRRELRILALLALLAVLGDAFVLSRRAPAA